MSALTCLLLCVQACLIQNAFGAYGWGLSGLAGPYGVAAPFAGPGLVEPFGYAGYADYGLASPCGCTPYGGAGVGNVAVAGELPVGGATAVAGQVPIIGAVEYAGPVCAAGGVTISGSCACGCGAPGYGYGYGIY